jgi:hypothetical protein
MVESEKTVVARKRLVKRVPAATNYHGNGFETKADFLKDKKDSIETLEGGDLSSVLPKL